LAAQWPLQLVHWCIGLAWVCSIINAHAMEGESYTSRIEALQRTLTILQDNPASTAAIRATRPITPVIWLDCIPEQSQEHHLKTLIQIIKQHGWDVIGPHVREQIIRNEWKDSIERGVGNPMPITADGPKQRPLPLIVCFSVVTAAIAAYDICQAYRSITCREWENEHGWYSKLVLIGSRTYLTKFLNRLR